MFINAFGIAFGQCLIEELGFDWVVASDEHGTEMAVHRKQNDAVVFPLNLVAKRYVNGETEFFVPVFDDIKGQLSIR
ncbi:DUF3806 domain-containing protein [Polystyrenella longa]|uniref:DUF3806 domain-containing protein n=1 Tax=Polystyrenella longa TaxID=2528007 RepID=UPI00119E6893|nr:DUF3806 domain-containing protein [Polystyrenella longa]